MTCSICLSKLRDPVCIPCGHVYCTPCLSHHVNAPGNSGLTASCPTCRKPFHLSLPDLTYLPEKYHPFISAQARRIYLDLQSDNDLRERLKKAETKAANLDQQRDVLLRKAEQLSKMVKVHREGEGEALLENEKLKDVVNTLEEYHTKALAAEVRKREAAERDLEVLRRQYERLSTSVENGVGPSSPQTPLSSRTKDPERTPTSGGSPAERRSRQIKPLPKTRLSRKTPRNSSPPPSWAYSKKARLSSGGFPSSVFGDESDDDSS